MKPTLLLLAAGMGSRYGGLKQLDAVCGAIAEGLEERKAEKVDAPAEGEDAPVKKERKTRISRKKAEDAEVAEITDEAPAAEVKEVEE